MTMYQLTSDANIVIRLDDGYRIPLDDKDGMAQRMYADWRAAGNTAQPPSSKTSAQVVDDIKAMRDKRLAGGFQLTVGGVVKWFHSDPTSKTQHLANKDTARDQIAAGGLMTDALKDPNSGQQVVWKTMDGTFVPLTCQLAYDIVKAAKGQEFATFNNAQTHINNVNASATPATYDYSTGWPAIYGG